MSTDLITVLREQQALTTFMTGVVLSTQERGRTGAFETFARVLYAHLTVLDRLLVPEVAGDAVEAKVKTAIQLVAGSLAESIANGPGLDGPAGIEGLRSSVASLFDVEHEVMRVATARMDASSVPVRAVQAEELFLGLVGPAELDPSFGLTPAARDIDSSEPPGRL